jgi:hypothetical protein
MRTRARFARRSATTPTTAISYGTGEDNRVQVDSVIPGSAAEIAGLQAGDLIESYADERLFAFSELRNKTTEGEYGEQVAVQVRRGPRVIETWVPRGPLGVTLSSARVEPVPDRRRWRCVGSGSERSGTVAAGARDAVGCGASSAGRALPADPWRRPASAPPRGRPRRVGPAAPCSRDRMLCRRGRAHSAGRRVAGADPHGDGPAALIGLRPVSAVRAGWMRDLPREPRMHCSSGITPAKRSLRSDPPPSASESTSSRSPATPSCGHRRPGRWRAPAVRRRSRRRRSTGAAPVLRPASRARLGSSSARERRSGWTRSSPTPRRQRGQTGASNDATTWRRPS